MRPWRREPSGYRVLALFQGGPLQLDTFLECWLRWGGGLDLSAAPLPPGSAGAWAIAAERVPAYHLIGWWLERPLEWELFYQPVDGEEGLSPRGVYLPWGFEVDSLPRNGTGPVLRRPSGEAVELPPRDEFRNLFDLLHLGRLAVLPPDGPPMRPEAPGSEARGTPFELRLRVVEARERQGPSNPEQERLRLQRRINALQEQVEALSLWIDPQPGGEMLIYPETGTIQAAGTLWQLRGWLAEARQEHVAEFLHTRVQVAGLDGPLHVLVPRRSEVLPRAHLPQPQYRLLLDSRWKRQLYVSEGWELHPPPPLHNDHVGGLMERSLWEEVEAGAALALLRTADGEVIRFPVTGFAPLAERMQEMNFQVALRRSQARPHPGTAMADLLARLREEMAAGLETHAQEIRRLLETFWSGDGADLARARQEVVKAREDEAAIAKLRQSIEAVRRGEERRWSGFCQEVLRLDRERFRPALAGLLAALDEIRSDLAVRTSAPPGQRTLARRLRDLADRLERQEE